MDTFDGMTEFQRVVEAGSFTGAAQRLGMSKSAVSAAISRLERRLGVRLLDRTTRRVSLTEAGRAFFRHGARAHEEAEAACAAAQALQSEPSGSLRIAVPEVFSRLYIVPALSSFFANYPAVQIELVESVRAVNLVEHGLDIAIRIAETLEPTLVVRRIGTSRVVVCASPEYLEARAAPLTPGDLEQHDLIGFSPLAWGREWRFSQEGTHIAVPIRPRLLCDSGESLRAAALAGLGIVAFPGWAAAELLRSGELVQILEQWKTPEAGLYAVYPSNRLNAAAVKAFVAHLGSWLKRSLF